MTTWLSAYLRNMCFYHIFQMIKSKYLRHCHSLIESDWHSFQVYSTTNYNAADRYRKSVPNDKNHDSESPGSERLNPGYLGTLNQVFMDTNCSRRTVRFESFEPRTGTLDRWVFMYIGCIFYSPVCTFLKIKNISLLMLMIMNHDGCFGHE